MTTENSAQAGENAEPASTEVDTQLAEMHTAEGAQGEQAEATPEAEESGEAKAPEVKKVVPLAALHEERRARQELQRQIAERDRAHAEQMQRINQRLETLMPQQQAPQRPDPNEQPVAYLDSKLNDIATQQQAIMAERQREQQARQQEAYVNQLASRIVGSEAMIAKENPDYGDAIAYLDDFRVRELGAMGVDEHQARQQAFNERKQAALQWAHEGRNPAELAYSIARARGYTPKAAAQAAQAAPNEKIAAQQRGTAAARSLGSGGAVNGGKLTAEALANMTDEDFAKLTDAQFKQALGG